MDNNKLDKAENGLVVENNKAENLKDSVNAEDSDKTDKLEKSSNTEDGCTNSDELDDSKTSNEDEKTHVTVIQRGDQTFHIIGTAHVSEKSRQEVTRMIETIKPDQVCVELCQERYDSFYDTERWKKLNIFTVIRKGKFLYLLANIAISAYQRRMGAELGVKPGAELIGAAEDAKKNGAEVVLIDRNINTTLKRVWGNLGFWTKCKLIGAIFESLFPDDESKEDKSKEIEELKNDSNLSAMMDVFAKELPEVHKPLIDERDHYLVAKMRECKGKNVIAVVGAGHVPGMKRYFEDEIDTNALDQLPKPSIVWTLVKWGIPLIIIGGIVYGCYSHGMDSLQDLLMAWILPNSFFCFILAILALAHPLTILLSIVVSPITSTTPVIGAGIVLGLLEAWLRKPTVEDCENLPNVHTLKDFYRNRFTHVLIVCVLTTFGSALGAWIGIGWLVKILGFDY